jgi:predicted phosphodiesterase
MSNLQDKLTTLASEQEIKQRKEKMLGAIADLLVAKDIDLEEIGNVEKVSIRHALSPDKDGVVQTKTTTTVQLSPKWETGPEWSVVKQGPSIKLPPIKATSKKATQFKTCVVVPDIQIGYYRGRDGELEPTHDEKAIQVALKIIVDAQPDVIVCVGDNLDLPEMGKYLTYPAYAQTTQAAIDRSTKFCAEMRAAAPTAKIIWLAGNHEERMPKYLLVNAGAAYGLRKGNTPNSWPVLSIPYLCRMDEFGVEYRPGYPASDYWINEKLRVIHGDRVKSSGSTAHIYLNSEKTSVIYGHIHRIETAFKTREDYDGPRTIMAASPGCLARIDGAIPSTRGGVDLDGRPLTRYENWQQGLGIVTYEDDQSHRFTYDVIPIYNGWALYHGKEYSAE